MDENLNARLESAFYDVILEGPDHAMTRLQHLRDTDAALARHVEPLVRHYLGRQRRMTPPAIATDPAVPERFRVTTLLGSGAFGDVYRAFDTRFQTEVAIKVLHTRESSSLRRFKEEFKTLTTIATHDNLVRLYEGFFETEPWMFTMEYVDGEDFVTFIRRSFAIDGHQQLRACLAQLAAGVNALHRHKYQHRDLKPSNVLVTRAGRVKVIDFGLVRELRESFEETASLAGTLVYMSPEQLTRGTVSEASDWYAVGVMLYELLTGGRPESFVTATAVPACQAPIELDADTPADLSALCMRLLDVNPRTRASFEDVVTIVQPGEALASRTLTDSFFTGRDTERQLLGQYFNESRTGPVVVQLSGPSGIGKTALLREVLADIRRQDPNVVVLAARCHQNQTVSYPTLDDLVDRLAEYLTSIPRARIEPILPRNVAALARMFPVMGRFGAPLHGSPAVESTELRLRGLGALAELIGRLSERCAVVLSIDDLHWADRNGCAFLLEMMTARDAPAVLLILSYRPDSDVPVWLNEWQTSQGRAAIGYPIHLDALGDSDTLFLASRLLKKSADGDSLLINQVAQISAGNPYLVCEVAEWVNAKNGIGPGIDTITTGDVLRSRMAGLTEDGRRLLELVAVACRPTDLEDLQRSNQFFNVLEARDDLRRARLTRSRNVEGREEIDVYHDRVRDAVLEMLDAPTKTERHRDLANALKMSHRIDCERIAVHLQNAGDPAACAPYATQAADQAFEALAFEKAAKFYQWVTDAGTLAAADRQYVCRRLADSLANSGQPARAARYYQEAAALTEDAGAQLGLMGRAADQLLRGGYIPEGLTILDRVMGRLRLRPPQMRSMLLARVAFLRLYLALRGLRFRASQANVLRDDDALRLQVCWTGAMVTSFLDPLRSAESSARYVLLALRSGSTAHIATALSCEAPLLCISGSPRRILKARNLLETTRLIADRAATPYAKARYLLSKGLVAFIQGEWRGAADDTDAAGEILRTGCVDVAWELAAADIFSGSSRFILGDWANATRLLGARIRDAESRGDSHLAVSLRVHGCYYLSTLAADEPAAAFDQLRKDVAAWPHNRADFFRCNVLQAEVDIALYSNDPIRADEAIARDWRRLDRALLLRNPTTFAFLHFARGRAALAMATVTSSGSTLGSLLKQALASARALEANGPIWSRGFAAVLRAGVASWQREELAPEQYLKKAEEVLAVAGIEPIRAAVRARWSQCASERRDERTESVEQWVDREHIIRFDRMVRALAPGNYEPRLRSTHAR